MTRKVLIVGSNSDDMLQLTKLLEMVCGDFQVDTATCSTDAISYMESNKYEICLFEYRLSDMNGIDLLRAVRKKGINYPVIFLTDASDHNVVVKAMKAGALDYLQKTDLSQETLCHTINAVMELSRKNEEIRNMKDFYADVIDGVAEPIMVINLSYEVILLNRVVREKYPLPSETEEPRLCYQVSHCCDKPCDGTNHVCPLTLVYESGHSIKVVHEHYQRDGEVRFIEILASPLRGSDGEIYAIVESTRDITERRIAEITLEFKVNHDSLTGLPNRLLFNDRLCQAMAIAKRYKKIFALLFLDLDNFKDVNDNLGHETGDLLLIEVGKRLRESVRESDTVARLGGDEFTVIIRNVEDINSVALVADKIKDNISRQYTLNSHTVSIGVSIGICLYSNDATNAEVLMKRADSAMYHAKKSGRNCHQFYTGGSLIEPGI
ncbi:diguanylate cyclase [Candidatus Magnetominusculus xianensis]|uniref:Diguanylate cyclase n=1 Tax=Candidatus Magnetominusculus xianensis TaxID=1748249 RepID=A0ABR5SD43_9BACT|nr:diguanylate cyclase [Candidatus Magnetominusculus xianensis]KWT82586.1 putative diguanylate cyclase [Candidatus Magnetominusculus xianensis]MBF0405162.1 diguanylate cyclase [Nitrospirota bacterium]